MKLARATTMRAAVITAPEQVRWERVPMPIPGPGQVRVRVEGSGVCASNLPLWQGRSWFEYPQPAGAPGHEGWGVVDDVGDGVTDVARGDRVAMLSYRAFAEFDLAAADALVRLPATLAHSPFPGEPLGCAMNVFRRSEIHAKQTVIIIGIGFLGALLCRLASRTGARVIAISRRPYALDVARHYGAAECIPLDDHWRIVERAKALTGGKGAERVIEAVGLQWPLDLATELCRERGRLVIAGYHQDGPRQVNMQLWNWRGLDVINAHERDPRVFLDGIRAAADAVASGELDPAPLYSSYTLDELDAAMRALGERRSGFVKALVRP